jgi:Rps23 Pro-64 3,4-dihydroxylase Tpa1-like proline 4-hydroxylase
MTNLEPLFVDDALLLQGEQLCTLRLAKDPDNRAFLASLGKIYRKQGKLAEATTVYARLTQLDAEDREAAYMHAVLAGTEVPLPPPGIHPAPFVLLKDYLPQSFHETLLPYAISIQDQLSPALVGNDEYRPQTRESLEFRGQCEVKQRFHKFVRGTIPTVLPRLHVGPFEMGILEVKLRAYLDGHFFRIHMDCPPNSEFNANRQVSYVYFFHKRPRGYTGGALLLFDTDTENNTFTTAGFTRIEPEDNSIVLFASAYYHSVVPVSCPSKHYTDSRFVINGHVSKRAAARPAVEAPPAGNESPINPPALPAPADNNTVEARS